MSMIEYLRYRMFGGPKDGQHVERSDPARFPQRIVFPVQGKGLALDEAVYELSGDVYLFAGISGAEFTITFE
jgi:hypothetical protein